MSSYDWSPESASLRDIYVRMADRRSEMHGTKWRALPPSALTSGPVSEIHDAEIKFSRRIEKFRAERRSCLEFAPRLSSHQLDVLAKHDPIPLPVASRISQILRYTLLPLRWEPQNYSAEHRGVASAGGLFSTESYLLVRRGDRTRMFHISPTNMCLIELAPVESSIGGGEGSTRILTVGKLSHSATDYAEFGIGLAVLEAGMIHAQLALTGHALGLRSRQTSYVIADVAVQQRICRHWSDIPVACLELETGAATWIEDLHERDLAVAVESDDYGPAEGLENLPGLTMAFSLPTGRGRASPVSDFALGPPGSMIPLFACIEQRSSGYLLGKGKTKRTVRFEDLEAALMIACRMFRGILDEAPVISVAFRPEGADLPVLYRLDVIGASLVPARQGQFASSAANRVCSGEVSAVVTIGFKETALFDAIDRVTLWSPFSMVGTVAQCICLSAAAKGFFARPSRAEPEKFMNLLLPPNAAGILQILVGVNSPAAPYFPLQ